MVNKRVHSQYPTFLYAALTNDKSVVDKFYDLRSFYSSVK